MAKKRKELTVEQLENLTRGHGKKYGIITEATVVDHIKPHRGDQKLFWDRGNWQALCKSCHDNKTLKEDINPVYTF